MTLTGPLHWMFHLKKRSTRWSYKAIPAPNCKISPFFPFVAVTDASSTNGCFLEFAAKDFKSVKIWRQIPLSFIQMELPGSKNLPLCLNQGAYQRKFNDFFTAGNQNIWPAFSLLFIAWLSNKNPLHSWWSVTQQGILQSPTLYLLKRPHMTSGIYAVLFDNSPDTLQGYAGLKKQTVCSIIQSNNRNVIMFCSDPASFINMN